MDKVADLHEVLKQQGGKHDAENAPNPQQF